MATELPPPNPNDVFTSHNDPPTAYQQALQGPGYAPGVHYNPASGSNHPLVPLPRDPLSVAPQLYQPTHDGRDQYPPPADPSYLYHTAHYAPQPIDSLCLHGLPTRGQKRAYRRRRKDPSCDACRERKVKCDATDTESCSECSGRNLTCQSTRETNRRMASIKQVQDLEKQVMEARQQVSQLQQHMVSGESKSAIEDDRSKEGPNKRRRLSWGQVSQVVARNIEKHGRNLIRLPASHIESSQWDYSSSMPPPELPSKDICEELIQAFQSMPYTAFSCFSTALLKQRHDELHAQQWGRPLLSQSWYALYLSVLAFGTLRHQKQDGQKFYQQATKLIDLRNTEQSMDSIRAILVLSMFQVESNNITSGSKTLGHAVTSALAMGLHRRTEWRSPQDEQACLILWWCLFSTERLLALELGRPSMIDDNDCPPFAQAAGYDICSIHRQNSMSGSDPKFIDQVVRCTTQLQKAFRQPFISPETLQEVDEQIDECAANLSPHHELSANEHLDMGATIPMIYVQSLHLTLHRHNLSRNSPVEVRKLALDKCVAAAKVMAHVMLRTAHNAPASALELSEGVKEEIRLASSAFFCHQLWRASVLLIVGGEYESAIHIIRAASAIGRYRIINITCGRYIEFLINHIQSKRNYDRLTPYKNKELLAFASGDLQSNLDQAWVWQSKSGSVPISPSDTEPGVSQEEEERWNGWRAILQSLKQMAEQPRLEKEKRSREAVVPRSLPPVVSIITSSNSGPPTPARGRKEKVIKSCTHRSTPLSIEELIRREE